MPSIAIAEALQYGAFGLLAIVIGGFFWYVRSIENRATRREAAAQDMQTRTIDMMMSLTEALVVLTKEIESHGERSTKEHTELITLYNKFSSRGIRE